MPPKNNIPFDNFFYINTDGTLRPFREEDIPMNIDESEDPIFRMYSIIYQLRNNVATDRTPSEIGGTTINPFEVSLDSDSDSDDLDADTIPEFQLQIVRLFNQLEDSIYEFNWGLIDNYIVNDIRFLTYLIESEEFHNFDPRNNHLHRLTIRQLLGLYRTFNERQNNINESIIRDNFSENISNIDSNNDISGFIQNLQRVFNTFRNQLEREATNEASIINRQMTILLDNEISEDYETRIQNTDSVQNGRRSVNGYASFQELLNAFHTRYEEYRERYNMLFSTSIGNIADYLNENRDDSNIEPIDHAAERISYYMDLDNLSLQFLLQDNPIDTTTTTTTKIPDNNSKGNGGGASGSNSANNGGASSNNDNSGNAAGDNKSNRNNNSGSDEKSYGPPSSKKGKTTIINKIDNSLIFINQVIINDKQTEKITEMTIDFKIKDLSKNPQINKIFKESINDIGLKILSSTYDFTKINDINENASRKLNEYNKLFGNVEFKIIIHDQDSSKKIIIATLYDFSNNEIGDLSIAIIKKEKVANTEQSKIPNSNISNNKPIGKVSTIPSYIDQDLLIDNYKKICSNNNAYTQFPKLNSVLQKFTQNLRKKYYYSKYYPEAKKDSLMASVRLNKILEKTNDYNAQVNVILDINRLLSLGANINFKDSAGRTALDIIFKKNLPNLHFYLIERGIRLEKNDINSFIYNGWTLLTKAVEYKKPLVVEKLLKMGAQINKVNGADRNAISYTEKDYSGNIIPDSDKKRKIVNLLQLYTVLQEGRDVDRIFRNNWTVLNIKNQDVILQLTDNSSKNSFVNWTALKIACDIQDEDAVLKLLKLGANPIIDYDEDNQNIKDLLLLAGLLVRPSQDDHWIEIFKYITKNTPIPLKDINQPINNDLNLLTAAIQFNRGDVVERLLAKGAKIHEVDGLGNTPLELVLENAVYTSMRIENKNTPISFDLAAKNYPIMSIFKEKYDSEEEYDLRGRFSEILNATDRDKVSSSKVTTVLTIVAGVSLILLMSIRKGRQHRGRQKQNQATINRIVKLFIRTPEQISSRISVLYKNGAISYTKIKHEKAQSNHLNYNISDEDYKKDLSDEDYKKDLSDEDYEEDSLKHTLLELSPEFEILSPEFEILSEDKDSQIVLNSLTKVVQYFLKTTNNTNTEDQINPNNQNQFKPKHIDIEDHSNPKFEDFQRMIKFIENTQSMIKNNTNADNCEEARDYNNDLEDSKNFIKNETSILYPNNDLNLWGNSLSYNDNFLYINNCESFNNNRSNSTANSSNSRTNLSNYFEGFNNLPNFSDTKLGPIAIGAIVLATCGIGGCVIIGSLALTIKYCFSDYSSKNKRRKPKNDITLEENIQEIEKEKLTRSSRIN